MGINYIVLAIPVFLISLAWEAWVAWKRKSDAYHFDDAITNLNIGIGSQVVGAIGKVMVMLVYIALYENAAFFYLPVDSLWVWLGTLVVYDFLYYWTHRWAHEWNILWGAHIVHHSSQQYNLSVALRQSWFQSSLTFVIFLPMAILGVDPAMFVAISGIVLLYQYWIHTRFIKKLPRPLEYIFNTPSHHRVHHAINEQYLDKNYAGTFIIWDRLFGTFKPEKETPVYGITSPLNSWDPVWANAHFYTEMAEGMKKEKGIFRKLFLLFRGPSYLARLKGQKHVPDAPPPVYEIPVAKPIQFYLLLQFLLLTGGLVLYLLYFEELSWFNRVAGMALIIIGAYSCGGIMERKKWALVGEPLRVVVSAAYIGWIYYYDYPSWFSFVLFSSIGMSLLLLVWFITQRRLVFTSQNSFS